jgi:hypothetical protein
VDQILRFAQDGCERFAPALAGSGRASRRAAKPLGTVRSGGLAGCSILACLLAVSPGTISALELGVELIKRKEP